jgi:hypothetical protein
LWVTGVAADTVDRFHGAGGSGPVWTQLTFCWDPDTDKAIDRAHHIWPNTALPGQLNQDLRTVKHFEQVVELVTREQIADALPCGPDIEPLIDGARRAVAAGADHVYFHQIGDPADGFIDVWRDQIRPALVDS